MGYVIIRTFRVRFLHLLSRRRPGTFLMGLVPGEADAFRHFNYDVTNSCPWHKRFVPSNRLVTVPITLSECASWCLQNVLLVENIRTSTAIWHKNKIIGPAHQHEVEPWFVNSTTKFAVSQSPSLSLQRIQSPYVHTTYQTGAKSQNKCRIYQDWEFPHEKNIHRWPKVMADLFRHKNQHDAFIQFAQILVDLLSVY